MEYQGEEADFSLPSFKPYVNELDSEYQGHVEAMMMEAFALLSRSEKLMMKPLIELYNLKVDLNALKTGAKGSLSVEENISKLQKQIKSRLDVLNENGDIHVLVKKYNLLLLDLYKKKSSKPLAKMGAGVILAFVDLLKSSGELGH